MRPTLEELGNDVPTAPLIFVKPASAYAKAEDPIAIPSWTNDLHHEVELVVAISERSSQANQEQALKAMKEVTLGLDLTARDLQAELKAKGHPWERAKAFDGAARVGPMREISENFWTTRSPLGTLHQRRVPSIGISERYDVAASSTDL